MFNPSDMETVPEHLREGLRNYIEHKVPTGSFLEAVLSNDLMKAMGKADLESRRGLYNVCEFLYNFAPPECYGSPEAYKNWVKKRNL